MKQFIILLFVALACARRPPRCRPVVKPVTNVEFQATLKQFQEKNVETKGVLNNTLVILEKNTGFFSTRNYTPILNTCLSMVVAPAPALFEKSNRVKREASSCLLIRSTMGAVIFLQGLINAILPEIDQNNNFLIDYGAALNATLPQADVQVINDVIDSVIAANSVTNTTLISIQTQQEYLLGGLNQNFDNLCNTTGIDTSTAGQLEVIIDNFQSLNTMSGGALGGVMNVFFNHSEFLFSGGYTNELLSILDYIWIPPPPTNVTAPLTGNCAQKAATLAQLETDNIALENIILNIDESPDLYIDLLDSIEATVPSDKFFIFDDLVEGAQVANLALRNITQEALTPQETLYTTLSAQYASDCP